MYKIYIVEDDATISGILSKHLSKWGFEILEVKDFSKITDEFLSFSPHLILMDIALPFYSGYHWCTEIRKLSSVPVIFISSADNDMNQIMAMNMGGDDYITKPFNLEIITAKIQAILRRTYDLQSPAILFELNGAAFNPAEAVVTYNGEKIELTKNEQRILLTLWENKNEIISRETLMIKLWDDDRFVDDNTLTVNITRLRKKLEDINFPGNISTKKGLGYILE